MSLRVGERGLAPLNEDAVDRGGVSGYLFDHLSFASHEATITFTFAALSWRASGAEYSARSFLFGFLLV